MQKENISFGQMICIIILFVFGSSVIMGVKASAMQDSWITVILACVITIPIILVYARILNLFPGKGLFDITELLFGKVGSKIIILLMTWYAMHLGALVITNFHEFIAVIDLPTTPHFVLTLPIIAVIIYLTKSGMKTLGNWAYIAFPIILLVVIFTITFSFQSADFSNLLPFLNHSIVELSKDAYGIFSFPFAELVLFMALFGFIKKEASAYKIYLSGVLIFAFILLLIVLRNTVLLGPTLINTQYYPSYVASRIIHVGDFLTRVEGTISVNFILAGITKIAVCVVVASIGLSKLFGIKEFKSMIIPSCLLMLAISFTSYHNIMQMFEFAQKYYAIYAFPFQIIIPLIIWITAEIRTRRGKRSLDFKSA